MFEILSDDRQVSDDQLPETGLSRELERAVSPVFIKSDGYGTRSSTILMVSNVKNVLFVERALDTNSGKWNESRFEFNLIK